MTLLLIASGAIGWRMQKAIARKQFRSQVERLQVRIQAGHRLAKAMQADWKGILKKEKQGWLFDLVCEEGSAKKFSPLRMDRMAIWLNGKPIDRLEIDFFTSGKLDVKGTLVFSWEGEKISWELASLLGSEEGLKSGPLFPK